MYQNAKALSLLKSGNVSEAKAMLKEVKPEGNDSVTLNDFSIQYENGNLVMTFSIVPNNPKDYVSCCLSGIDQGNNQIAANWNSMDITATGSTAYNNVLIAAFKKPDSVFVTGTIVGIITSGKESSFFSFSGDFEV